MFHSHEFNFQTFNHLTSTHRKRQGTLQMYLLLISAYYKWLQVTLNPSSTPGHFRALKVLTKSKWTIYLVSTHCLEVNNPWKLIHRFCIFFVLVIFNQNLNICFHSGMAFLLRWCQFDGRGRTSLTTGLAMTETERRSTKIKPRPLFNIPFQLEIRRAG